MQDTNNQDIRPVDAINHDMGAERMHPHRGRKLVSLSRRARIVSQEREEALQSSVIFLGLRDSVFGSAAQEYLGDVVLGGVCEPIGQSLF